jgi:hypothetical protein
MEPFLPRIWLIKGGILVPVWILLAHAPNVLDATSHAICFGLPEYSTVYITVQYSMYVQYYSTVQYVCYTQAHLS